MKRKTFFFLVRFFLIIHISVFLFPSACAQPYFQQQVNTEIHVSLNDVKHELKATERIEYTNHSPVALFEIVMHVWPNAYRNENTALAKQLADHGDPVLLNASQKQRGFIDSLDFEVDGKKIKWNFLQDTIDVCILTLNAPVMPGEKIVITTPFYIKIPSADISRLGHNGQSYLITQWFPKPAVFDRNGWNYFPYLNQGEFYSEFGTYDVFITLPKNYVVGATGEIVDGESELKWLNQKSDETKAIKEFTDDLSFPPSSDEVKTLHYRINNAHDFAWFADKRWHVLKEEIELPVSKRKVTSWMMFTNEEADYWKQFMGASEIILNKFSKWMGEYPYNTITAVDVTVAAGSGMEYPSIYTVGNNRSKFVMEITMAHEIGHNWFYGMLGSNERKHPWMDEGLTNFLETRYVSSKYTDDEEKQLEEFAESSWFTRNLGVDQLTHRKYLYQYYLFAARKNTDQAPETPADQVHPNNYGSDVYFKTAIGFDFLKSYLGDSVFDLCIQRYVEEWKFRHPQPEDFKKSIEATSGKNLDWLFGDLISTNRKLDYCLSSIKYSDENKNYLLTVYNSGKVAAPFAISSIRDNRVQQTRWFDGFKEKQAVNVECDQCDQFTLDAAEKMPELNRGNNTIRTSGILKKTEPLRFHFLGSLENPARTQINYSPVIGWNYYNKLMAGAAFYNIFIPEKKFEYVLMPLYATHTKDLTGGGNLTYNLYPINSSLHKIALSFGAQSYSYLNDTSFQSEGRTPTILKYSKFDSRISFYFLPKNKWEKKKYDIVLRNVTIVKDQPYFYQGKASSNTISIFELSANRSQLSKINPSNLNLKIRANGNLFLASIEEQFKISYKDIDKGFSMRIFAGNIFYRNTTLQGEDYRFRLSGYSGSEDYLFDEVFLGRSESSGLLSRQFVATEGGFAVPTYFYRSASEWLITMNFKTSLPGILPVKLFADIGTFNQADALTSSSISFDLGVELNLINNIFTIYFPFAYSNDIKYIIDQEELNFGNLIRFELHLNKLNPLTLLRQLEL